MESKDELKEVDIKNRKCYYFDDIMKARDIDSGNISVDKKIYKSIFAYDISYKTFIGSKPLHIWFNKIDRLFKIYDGIRYLVILSHSWFGEICCSIKYFISEKSGITDSINYNLAGVRTD